MLAAGQYGIDYAGAAINAGAAYAAGARFTLRYSAGAGTANGLTDFKLCKLGEIAGICLSGQDFVANSEWYETRVTEGAAAGAADGAADLRFWQSRGLNRGASIYCSWDTGQPSWQWDAVAAYLDAYRNSTGGYYLPDLYAGTPAIREMKRRGLIRYGWRANAGSWSNDGLPYQPSHEWIAANLATAQAATPAAIWQTGNYWFNNGADENVLLRPQIGSHLQAAHPYEPPPAPAVEESDTMNIVSVSTRGIGILRQDGTILHLSQGQWNAIAAWGKRNPDRFHVDMAMTPAHWDALLPKAGVVRGLLSGEQQDPMTTGNEGASS